MTSLLSVFPFLLILFAGLVNGCTSDPAEQQVPGLQKIGQMPAQVDESSGIETTDEPGVFLTHNDAGGKPVLYKINSEGQLLEKIPVPDAKNNDWEDLTRDSRGYLYIGDFGNNSHRRENLRIYKVRLDGFRNEGEIKFRYAGQEEGSFDAESMFWHNGKLYVITKMRGGKKPAEVYELPDQPGEYVAKKVETLDTKRPVTSAAISPNGQRLALLSNKRLLLFDVPAGNNPPFCKQEPKSISIKETGQAEGVVFLDANTLLLTDEEGGIYRYVDREEGQ